MGKQYELNGRAILNPGSVGQPTTGTPELLMPYSIPKPKFGNRAGWSMILSQCSSASWMQGSRRGMPSAWLEAGKEANEEMKGVRASAARFQVGRNIYRMQSV